MDDSSLQNPVHIGFYDPFGVYASIKDEIERRLPLKNLNWKYHTKPITSIDVIPVRFTEEVPRPNGPVPPLATTFEGALLSKTNHNIYARIIFVKYENLDVYRSQVRPLIKEWLKNIVLPSGLEWMIVFYMPLGSKDKQSTIIKTSNFDKLKLDFDQDGKELNALDHEHTPSELERCFKLKEKNEERDSYSDLIFNLKQMLLTAFNKNYSTFTTNSGDSGSDLDMFFRKLTLARILSDMRLLQDSLTVYNELQNLLDSLYVKTPSNFHISDNFHIDFDQDYVKQTNALRTRMFTEDKKINLVETKALLFVNESMILQLLASSPKNPISISALHISNLYQKLSSFLHGLPDGDHVGEMKIATADKYLSLPIYHKILSANEANNANNNDGRVYQLNEILEFRGELILLKRSTLADIAKTLGMSISRNLGVLEDVSLDDTPKKEAEFGYKPLKEVFESNESYLHTYQELTEEAIRNFVPCNRTKTVDMLSIDLAILNYQNGKYEEAYEVLQNLCDFFIQKGWSFLGGILLEIYLDCVEKLHPDNHELIVVTCLKVLASIHQEEKSGGKINFRGFKNQESIRQLYEKILLQSKDLSTPTAFALDDLFVTTIVPFIQASPENYTYYVELDIENLFNVDFKFAYIKIDYVSLGELLMSFEARDIVIDKRKDHRIRLYSRHFKARSYTPLSIRIQVDKNIEFVKEFYDTDDADGVADATVIMPGEGMDRMEIANISSDSPVYTLFQNIDSLWCEFANSSVVNLGTTELELRIHNGKKKVSAVEIEIGSTNEGLKLDFDPEKLKRDVLEPEETTIVRVPYQYYSDNKIIRVETTVKYTIDGEQHTHLISDEVDTSLKIAVSVQDVFRRDFIISKFQIGTSKPKSPIRITGNHLYSANNKYKIEHPTHGLGELVAFGEQPASVFFKITPQEGEAVLTSDTLDLSIDYSVLEEECIEHASYHLLGELSKMDLQKYWFVVRDVIISMMQFDLTNYALNDEIVVVNESQVWKAAESAVLHNLKKYEEQVLVSNLFKVSAIPVTDTLSLQRKKLQISVPMPILNYLHLAEFQFEQKPHFLVGEPFEVLLNVETTTRWFSSDEEQVKDDENEGGSPTFQIEIQNDDNWLISGFKRRTFSIGEELTATLKMTLIPLNVGKIQLPKLLILAIGAEPNTLMDTIVKNGMETVLVVPEVERVTFSF